MQPQLDELAVIENQYEANLKGYLITEPKDESKKSDGIETLASDSFVKMLRDSLDNSFTKTNVQTRAFSNDVLSVGVLKFSTCGTYPEFNYLQDNEDGGWTRVEGNVGTTFVDGNKNMNWKFCVVPGMQSVLPGTVSSLRGYGGGVLLLSRYTWTEIDGPTHVVERYHDDEDNNNKNQILNYGGLTKVGDYIGNSLFNKNTGLTWLFTDTKGNGGYLGFSHGVITNNPANKIGSIYIDDENGSNANWSRHYATYSSQNSVITYNDNFRGILVDTNTTYHIAAYNN